MTIHPVAGFGSVHDVPRLPPGFRDVFDSSLVDVGDVRLHVVHGGRGPALLLLAGWPQNWFAWRYLMLPLAKHFTVVAADPRGVGLSSKAAEGYDADSLALDMLGLMTALGHERFSLVGYDLGMWTGFAVASDAPERVERVALGEASIPGFSASPPLISDDRRTSDLLWHLNFNRVLGVNERLVEGREDIFIGHQFATKAGSPDAVAAYARDFYVELMRRVPGALSCGFAYYRALDASIPMYRRRASRRLVMPVLAFGGAITFGDAVERELRRVADDLTAVVIPDCGHYVAEEQPQALLDALLPFLTGCADR